MPLEGVNAQSRAADDLKKKRDVWLLALSLSLSLSLTLLCTDVERRTVCVRALGKAQCVEEDNIKSAIFWFCFV